jgi:hypothetical protein
MTNMNPEQIAQAYADLEKGIATGLVCEPCLWETEATDDPAHRKCKVCDRLVPAT